MSRPISLPAEAIYATIDDAERSLLWQGFRLGERCTWFKRERGVIAGCYLIEPDKVDSTACRVVYEIDATVQVAA